MLVVSDFQMQNNESGSGSESWRSGSHHGEHVPARIARSVPSLFSPDEEMG